MKISTKDICFIAVFTAIIIVLAQVSIPMPYGVPMTMQTFAVLLAGVVLGAKKGTIAALIYVLLGLAGLPVYSGFKGGIGSILGATGGFIISFPFMTLLAGWGAEKRSKLWLVAGLIAGMAINYIFGMGMYSLIMATTLQSAFIACVLPFIPTAILKAILAGAVGVQVRAALGKFQKKAGDSN